MKKINDELKEDIKACMVEEKNSSKCIDRVLKEHGFDEDDKPEVLQRIIKTR
jgi:hypothetical protein